MSVSVDIVGYRNKAEGNKLIQDADALLKLRANLNQGNSEAINNYYERQKFNIPPVFKQTSTAEEELRDSSLQRQKALASLRTIMKEPDVLRSLDWLSTNNELNEFNRYSTLFLREIAGQKNITPTYFETLWDRYKEKLLATGNTGIAIGAEPGEYQTEIAEIVKGISDIEAISEKKVAGVEREKIRDEIEYLNKLKDEFLDDALNREYNRVESKNLSSGDMLTIPYGRNMYTSDYLVDEDVKTGLFQLSNTVKKPKFYFDKVNKIRYIIYHKFNATLKKDFDPINFKLTDIYIQKKSGKGFRKLGRKVKKPSGTGFNHFAIYGAGLEVDRPEPLAIDNHKPRRETLIPNQKNFGNYALSLNSLKKGFLCVRYPSGAQIPHFPKVMISSRFRKIVNDIVYEDKFEEEDYMNLDEQEQKLFDDLITFCKMDKRDNVKIYKHKKYTDKDRDETIKRFNVIKGELLAGNDNPNVVKELKLLMMKMYNEKIISKAELNKIMYQLHLTV